MLAESKDEKSSGFSAFRIHLRNRFGAGATPHCFRDRQEDRQGLRLWRCRGRVSLASTHFVIPIHYDLSYSLPCLESHD